MCGLAIAYSNLPESDEAEDDSSQADDTTSEVSDSKLNTMIHA